MRAILLACVLALAGVLPARAEDNPLAPFAFLHGCWRGAFQGQAGVTDEHCFAPMLDGRFLRDAHVVRGAPEAYSGESIYAFDPETRRVVFSYYASDGGMSRGVAEVAADGFRFPADRYVGADGRVLNLREHWIRRGADAYDAITEVESNGEWREMMRVSFQRVTPTP